MRETINPYTILSTLYGINDKKYVLFEGEIVECYDFYIEIDEHSRTGISYNYKVIQSLISSRIGHKSSYSTRRPATNNVIHLSDEIRFFDDIESLKLFYELRHWRG